MENKRIIASNTVILYAVLFAVGIIVGFREIIAVVGFSYLLLAGWLIYLALNNDYPNLFCLLPYMIYSELFIRSYASFVPYLFMPYLYITLFFLLIIQNSTSWKLYTRSFILIVFFMVIEFINSTRSTLPDIARGLEMNSLAFAVIAVWGSFNIITPRLANRMLRNVKYASIYLCGIVIARYLVGDVEFGSHSGSEGVNGLAPVQLSGYLGFSCIVFFFSIMDDSERKQLLLNLFLMAMCAVVMMLSFSRGGVYFIGIVMCLYFLFNGAKVKSYFLLLLLLPAALGVYSYVDDTTHGLIDQRYNEEGSSGRDELVDAGFTIFLQDPIAGVGTANFATEITKRSLYFVESGAHNEFVRVAAEDGILGVITYWGFFITLGINIMKRKRVQREYAIYFLALFCLIIIHNGLKISVQPFLILLAVSTHSVESVKRKKIVPSQNKFITGPV